MKKLMLLGLLALILSLFLTVPLYAKPEYEGDCISCHTKGGVTVTSNITDTIEIPASSTFSIEITAEGGAEELTIMWSAVAGNPSFIFSPSKIVDNGLNDLDPEENKVRGIFKVSAPTKEGEYVIQVFAAGSGGKAGTLMLKVIVKAGKMLPSIRRNMPPNAYFIYSRQGLTIEFKDRSWDVDSNIVSWRWDFGDGSTSTEQNPIHTFSEPGTYLVVLTVTDDKGSTATRSQTFTIPPPEELRLLWITQIFFVSVAIIFSSFFIISMAARKRS
jgi:PKD repeat protein